MLEPERIPAEVENLLEELELKQNSPQDDCPPRNARIRNIDWCACSKICEAMMTETENLCCKDGNDIPDELFTGIILLCQLVLMSVTADSGSISWTPTKI